MLVHLTLLGLYGNRIGRLGGWAEEIASSLTLKNLKILGLGNNAIEDDNVKAIADSKTLTNLTTLDLSMNPIGWRALVKSKTLTSLRTLNLSRNQFFGDFNPPGRYGTTIYWMDNFEVEDIANSKALTNLTSLDLSYNYINSVGAKHVAASETLTKLEVLNLSNNQIGLSGVKALVTSKKLKNLKVLNLVWNGLEAEKDAIRASSTLIGCKIGL